MRIYKNCAYSIWLTTKCNLKCKYCYEHLKPGFRMDEEILLASLKFMNMHNRRLGVKKCYVQLHGGEPLLEFDLIKLFFNTIKEKDFNIPISTTLTTNGTLLVNDGHINKEIINFLVENINDLSISIDGNAENHDLNRTDYEENGTYDLVEKVVPYILKKRPDCRARMTVTVYTVRDLVKNVISIAGLGFKRIAIMPDYYDVWNDEMCNLYYKQSVNVIKMKQNQLKDVEISIGDTLQFRKRNSICGGGRNSITIYSNGQIFPCTYSVGISEECVGTVYSGLMEEKVREIEACARRLVLECIGCASYDYCPATRCKIVNKRLTGGYDTPSGIMCSFERIEHRLLVEQRNNLI